MAEKRTAMHIGQLPPISALDDDCLFVVEHQGNAEKMGSGQLRAYVEAVAQDAAEEIAGGGSSSGTGGGTGEGGGGTGEDSGTATTGTRDHNKLINRTVDGAHPASAISIDPTGTPLTATNAQDAIVQLANGRGVPGPPGRDGHDGQDGTDGKSAYEIAVENGFTGTQQDWLDSLQGDGTNDHNELANRDAPECHPEDSITNLTRDLSHRVDWGAAISLLLDRSFWGPGPYTLEIREVEDEVSTPENPTVNATPTAFGVNTAVHDIDVSNGETPTITIAGEWNYVWGIFSAKKNNLSASGIIIASTGYYAYFKRLMTQDGYLWGTTMEHVGGNTIISVDADVSHAYEEFGNFILLAI